MTVLAVCPHCGDLQALQWGQPCRVCHQPIRDEPTPVWFPANIDLVQKAVAIWPGDFSSLADQLLKRHFTFDEQEGVAQAIALLILQVSQNPCLPRPDKSP